MKLRPGAQSVLSSPLVLDVVDRANLPASLSDARPFHEDRPSLLANAPAEAKDMKSPPITADPSKALLAPTWCRRSFARVRARLRKSTEGRIVIVRQPCCAELEQPIISRDWSEHYLWKGRRGCRFTS